MGEIPLADWERKLRAELETGGLWIEDAQAHPLEHYRPYNHNTLFPVRSPTFPVYEDLEERLLESGPDPDPVIAHVLATCSGYAYGDADTVSMMMARMGLENNRCLMIRSSVDAMLICSTAFLIQSESGRVAILCYRGTEPLNFINWVVDLDVSEGQRSYQVGDIEAAVHSGFYRGVRATRYQVLGALKGATEGRPIRRLLPDELDGAGPAKLDGLETLYVTGHSLGGAMAALLAAMLRHEAKFREPASKGGKSLFDSLRAVYTYGQPMVGDGRLALTKAGEPEKFLRDNVFRYVHRNDIVPCLPPSAFGAFRHFGKEIRNRTSLLSHVMERTIRRHPTARIPGAAAWRSLSAAASVALDMAEHSPALSIRLAGEATGQLSDLATRLGSAGSSPGEWKVRRYSTRPLPSSTLATGLAAQSFVLNKVEALRLLPAPYSFEDHFPYHYIRSLTPPGVSDEYGD